MLQARSETFRSIVPGGAYVFAPRQSLMGFW